MFKRLPSLIPASMAMLASVLALHAPTCAATVNLLRGDPGFEVGLEGWHAYSGPWRTPYLATDFFSRRVAGLPEPTVSADAAWHGLRSLELNHPADDRFRTYVVGAPVKLDRNKSYNFSAMAKCEQATNVQLRIISEQNNKDHESKLQAATTRVGREWMRVVLPVPPGIKDRVLPAIDMQSAGRCWFDGLALVVGSGSPTTFDPPAPVVMSIQPGGDGKPWTRNLHLSRPSDTSVDVSYELAMFGYASKETSLTLSVELFSPEGSAPVQTVMKNEVIALASGNRRTVPLNFTVAPTGVWKLRATAKSASGDTITAEAAIGTMRPHEGKPDPFFGTHLKWDPMVEVMGFGAIRDMRLLEWNVIQPRRDRWNWPDSGELQRIKSFVENGGTYLATLVGESPTKHDYFAKSWGKRSYGQMPLWAGDGKADVSNSDYKRIFHLPTADAIETYAGGIASRLPFLSLEVMNEPLYYMEPADYVFVLKHAHDAIKRANPKVRVAAFANPPDWFYLPEGARAKWKGVQPYRWHEEAFQLGAADYLDVVTLHTYDRTHKNETPESGYGTGQASWAMGFKKYMKPEQQVWISEKGISSPSWVGIFDVDADRGFHQKVSSPITQARWIVRSQLDALGKGIGQFYLWNRPWSQSSHERFLPVADSAYTLFEVDGSPRPALVAQRVLIERLSQATRVQGGEISKGVRYEVFARSDRNEAVAVIWRYGKNEKDELRTSTIRMNCTGVPSGVRAVDLYGVETPSCENGTFAIGYSPVYLVLSGKDNAAALAESITGGALLMR